MKRIRVAVRRKAARIKLLLLDVDGVLTDGRIMVDDHGVETKQFHVRDGQGIALLMRAGIRVGFVTGRTSNAVRHRAKELGVTLVYQGVQDKLHAYRQVKTRVKLKDDAIAYIGDDIIDLPILRLAGLAVAVRDAWPGLFRWVDLVTKARGGVGAVREVSELLLDAQGKWPISTKSRS